MIPVNPITNLTDAEKDKLLQELIKSLEQLKKEVVDLKNGQLRSEFPEEVIEEHGLEISKPHRLKSGHGWRPLLESEILEGYEKGNGTAMGAARYLGVNYKAFRRWAIRYGIFKTDPWKKGSKRGNWDPNKGKYPLNQILEGKFPDYPLFRLKDLLIRSGLKKAACEICKMNDRREHDNKMALVVDSKDGNDKNHNIDNLEILCFNCYFLYGNGKGTRLQLYKDPDRAQGATEDVPARF